MLRLRTCRLHISVRWTKVIAMWRRSKQVQRRREQASLQRRKEEALRLGEPDMLGSFLDGWVTETRSGSFALPRGVPGGGICLDLATAGDYFSRIAGQEYARASYSQALKWYTRVVRLLGLWITFAVQDRRAYPMVRRLPGMAGRGGGPALRVLSGSGSGAESMTCQLLAQAYNRANTRDELADYEGALSDRARALDVANRAESMACQLLAEAYYNRANTRDEFADYEGALSDYARALDVGNPKPWNVRRNRALVYEKLGRIQEAQRDLATALDEIPAGKHEDQEAIERILARVSHADDAGLRSAPGPLGAFERDAGRLRGGRRRRGQP